MGNLGPVGISGDYGLGVDTTGNICLVRDICTYIGENTPLGGGAGFAISGSNGLLSSGTSSSQGIYFYGGGGVLGEGQIMGSNDGSVSLGRGVIGFGVGGGGGRVSCTTQTFCPR
jgi:hypothetical protein